MQHNLFRQRKTNFENLQYIVVKPDAPPLQYTAHKYQFENEYNMNKKKPIFLISETQKIESEGGMMIINGGRRRTPGGVFLFLLKKADNISSEDLKIIFQEDKNKRNRELKDLQALSREKKVEELKKTLNENGELN